MCVCVLPHTWKKLISNKDNGGACFCNRELAATVLSSSKLSEVGGGRERGWNVVHEVVAREPQEGRGGGEKA